ncbi:MAG TPA: hypothetical protein VEQ59_03365 [Polyangiaceae bacterium]|nr:hypothetical protein [Polyangiaceae bacterium]
MREPARREVAMRRLSFKKLFAVGAACLAAGLLPSCADNDSMMYIVGVAARQSGACAVKADLASTILAKGTMDRLLASDYTAALIVGNQLTQRGDRERLRTETSKIALKGAEVHLENTQGAELVPAFSAIGTGFVDSSEGADAAPAVMFATLIPASIAKTLPVGTVVSKVRVFGTTLGGQDVESAELLFPIDVCEGCLVSFPASARDLTADGSEYQCLLSADDTATATTDTASPCQLGIDLPTPCTSCSGLYDFCRSPCSNPSYECPP